MYKAIVVDDEKHIREGIFKFINISDVGIEAVACLADGKDAIEYICANHVDIVITDIRMVHVSGLELAKYIYENKPDINVIIISGFKEFEYARQAIVYNVQNYLIKPTKPDEIKKILIQLKAELDEINDINTRNQMVNELIPIIKEEFINEILVGGLVDEEKINKKIAVLKLNPKLLSMPCLVININMTENTKKWEYGKEGFQNFILNTFANKFDKYDEFDFFKIFDSDYSTRFLIISRQEENREAFLKMAEAYLLTVRNQLEQISGTSIAVKVSNSYDNLEQLKERSFSLSDEVSFNEKVKMLASHIVENQTSEAYDIINSVINSIDELPILKDYYLKLFDTLYINLAENTKFTKANVKDDFKKIAVLSTRNEIAGYSNRLIKSILTYFEERGDDAANQIMAIAQKYIEENYRNDISLSDVAAKAYLSPVYLSKFFKKHMGENFSDYLVRVRMTHAVEFLKKNYKIEDVSRFSGYNSSRYFHRIFKAYYGMSPKEYGRKHFGGLEDK